MQRCNVATLEKMLYLCPEIFPKAGNISRKPREYFFEAKRLLLRGQENTSRLECDT